MDKNPNHPDCPGPHCVCSDTWYAVAARRSVQRDGLRDELKAAKSELRRMRKVIRRLIDEFVILGEENAAREFVKAALKPKRKKGK